MKLTQTHMDKNTVFCSRTECLKWIFVFNAPASFQPYFIYHDFYFWPNFKNRYEKCWWQIQTCVVHISNKGFQAQYAFYLKQFTLMNIH